MAHQDAGHYAAKHPPETRLNQQAAALVETYLKDGKISCAAAHKIAAELHIAPAEVGVTIDLLEARISKCQLGLFGYSPKKCIVQPAETVSPELQQAIEEALEEQRLPCLAAWQIAERFKLPRLDISAACDALNIKITACQLGSFG